MALPQQLLSALQYTKGFNKEAFEKVHTSGEQITSIRINPFKVNNFSSISVLEEGEAAIPWSQYGYYLKERPSFTFDPLFHAGTYYVQEASSMFVEQALKQTVHLAQPLKVLDLCAAPGGKSTHIQSLLSKESLLVSNEVIRSRAAVLKENMIKWGGDNVMVTNNDPADFSKLINYFDVIVVDAPCSGSGLFRRDETAIEEWSENNVALCSQRQQRILADVLPALKPGGVLVYSTCSYSQQENEDVVRWLHTTFSLQPIPLHVDKEWGIVETDGGYRFWPDKVKGEGFFMACFTKETEEITKAKAVLKNKLIPATKNEKEEIAKWLNTDGYTLLKNKNTVYAWRSNLLNDFTFLMENLRVIYSGVLLGELMRNKFVPDHALAVNTLINIYSSKVELTIENAIRYLQRKDIVLSAEPIGWKLVTYKGKNLGWVNVLLNRVNNYYPKEWRILREK